jgi:hypothetical protein
MLFKLLDKLNNNTFSLFKWILTGLSGLLTTGLILMLEI